MISDLLFNNFLSGSSNISSFSVRHRLQRFEDALQDLYNSFIFQDNRGFSCFVFTFQYSVDNVVSCLYNGMLNDFLWLQQRF